MPTPGETICGEIVLEQLAPTSLGAEVFQQAFVARDILRDEHLWLTVIDGAFVPDSVAMSTFMAGANALVGVRHPSLVRVVLVDREEDYCVVGYEQLPGAEALGELIARGGGRKVLARAAIEIARGLAFLHRRDLLHGALTPGTVLLWEGVPLLWQHGIAGLCNSREFGPRARTLGGDVVAPEVPMGNPLTPAVDVYAWGAVVASIASGMLGAEAVSAVRRGEVDPGRHGPLLGVVRQALSVDPTERPSDGVHLLELLQGALESTDSSGAPGTGESSGPSPDSLQDLARRYLAEMDTLEKGSGGASGGGTSGGGRGPAPEATPGAIGRVALVKRPARAGSGAGASAGAGVVREVDRRAESSGLNPQAGAPVAQEPDWSHRLPSSAVAEVPQTEGPGLVRGPEPGVSGADAGLLAAFQRASEAKAKAELSVSGWLRPAPPLVGVGGLFDWREPMMELADGVRKRALLRPGSLPSPPADAPPLQQGVPEAVADAPTPPSPHDTGPDFGGALDNPEMDHPTPDPDELHARMTGLEPELPPPEPELPPPEPELPPPEPELPPMAGAPHTPSPPAPDKRRPVEPFRVPRRPGPHGPPSAIMSTVLLLVAGVLALGSTLAASSARGGFANLLGRGLSAEEVASGTAQPTEATGAAEAVAEPSGPCDNGMIEIVGDDESFCIDRAEYPGIDRVPATEVDLPHARQACEARGHALCTEAQWVRACRGASGWKFPYGPRREAGRCRVGDASAAPGPSGADPHCVTPEGVLDLVGNVSEWVEDGVVLGGSVRSKKSASCTARKSSKPTAKGAAVGFRCCAPLAGAGDSGGTAAGGSESG